MEYSEKPPSILVERNKIKLLGQIMESGILQGGGESDVDDANSDGVRLAHLTVAVGGIAGARHFSYR